MGALALALLAATSLGAVKVSLVDWGQAFAPERSGSAQVLWELRVPRALLAAAVGAALGVGPAAPSAPWPWC